MRESLKKINTPPILINPHFWLILIITLVVFLIYQKWPWRIWQFEEGLWQWVPWLSSLFYFALMEVRANIIGSLFLIPILYATVVFRAWGAFILSLISIASVLPYVTSMGLEFSLITVMVLMIPAMVVLVIKIELELRRKDKLSVIKERQKYTSMVFDAQEAERRRISQELHDETMQTLAAIFKRAENIPPFEYDTEISWIKDKILFTITNLRRITLDLRPSVLDDIGLVPALRLLVDQINKECETRIAILLEGNERKLSPQVEITIFRLVQEALNNIKYHSKAREATVILNFNIKTIEITVRDNGIGILRLDKPSELVLKGKLGMIGMRERVESLSGKYQVYSEPGVGTELRMDIKC